MLNLLVILGTLATLVALRNFANVPWGMTHDYFMGVSLGKKHMRDTYGIDEDVEYHN